MGSVGDWDEIIDEAEAERFVGRENELELFRQQVRLDKPRYLIFYITGQGGSGKTTLLNRYQDIARGFNFVITSCDEKQRDVPAVLGRFAQQLAEQGFPLKHFDEQYKMYRQKLHEIENDPEAPQGLAAMLGRVIVRAAYIGGDLVPGLRQGLEFLPRESVEAQASEWTTYLAKKLTNKDDIALIREPVSILTPLFFEDLRGVVQKRKALLCFDNFEATRIELQEWLVRLPEYKPSQNIRIVIAGRDQPGAKWDSLRNVTKAVPIDVFTDQEAEAFLDACATPEVQRIMLIDGPSVLGWDVWRAIDTDYGLGRLETAVHQAMEAGSLLPGSSTAVAHVLAGALDEAAMVVARADDPQSARQEMGQTVRRLLEGLRGPSA